MRTIMTLETMLRTASLETLARWVADVEQSCGWDSITATETRYVVEAERKRRLEE